MFVNGRGTCTLSCFPKPGRLFLVVSGGESACQEVEEAEEPFLLSSSMRIKPHMQVTHAIGSLQCLKLTNSRVSFFVLTQ